MSGRQNLRYNISMNATIISLAVLLLSVLFFSGIALIRLGCRWTSGFWPSWLDATKAAFWSLIATTPISVVAQAPAFESKPSAVLLLFPLILGIGAWVLGFTLKHPDTGKIGIKRGAIVSLVWGGGSLLAGIITGMVISVIVPSILQQHEDPPSSIDTDPSTETQVDRDDEDASVRTMREHYNAIYAAHSDADSIVDSAAFASWRASRSQQDQAIISEVIRSGTTSQIIDMFSLYKSDMRTLQSNKVPATLERSPSASPRVRNDVDMTNKAYRMYPYINDVATHGDRWLAPFKAWRREFLALGYPDAASEAAKTVDRYRLDGFGACYPHPESIERGRCN